MDWRDHLPGFKKDESKAEPPGGRPSVPDMPNPPPPPPMPPSAFRQFGNVLVRPIEVTAICFSKKEREISFALKNGDSYLANFEYAAKFDATLVQIGKVFNIDIKEP
jgi:hypothetical protein